jgi:hypothetical protein
MNEWTNERRKERKNEWMKERMNKGMNEIMKEGVKDWINESMNDSVKERISEKKGSWFHSSKNWNSGQIPAQDPQILTSGNDTFQRLSKGMAWIHFKLTKLLWESQNFWQICHSCLEGLEDSQVVGDHNFAWIGLKTSEINCHFHQKWLLFILRAFFRISFEKISSHLCENTEITPSTYLRSSWVLMNIIT